MSARVVLADDHESYRRGLARAIRDDPLLELVAEVSNGAAAVEAVTRLRPDLAVLDVRMPGVDGFVACERIAPAGSTRVVLITDAPSEPLQSLAASVGAAALLDKSSSRVALCTRLKEIAHDVV